MNTLQRSFLLIVFFLTAIRGLAVAAAPLDVGWGIDVKARSISYSIKNNTPSVISFSPDVIVLTRHENELWPGTSSEKDSILHLSVEIVMPKNVPCQTVYSRIGTTPPPVEIKPNETKSFSYSLSKTFPFSSHPEVVEQIQYAQCKIMLNDKVVYEVQMKYNSGKWTVNTAIDK